MDSKVYQVKFFAYEPGIHPKQSHSSHYHENGAICGSVDQRYSTGLLRELDLSQNTEPLGIGNRGSSCGIPDGSDRNLDPVWVLGRLSG